MKTTIVTAALLLCALSLIFTSCGADEDSVDPKSGALQGTYQLQFDGTIVSEGISDEVGFIESNGKWVVSMAEGLNLTLLASQVPINVGESLTFSGNLSGISFSITGEKLPKVNGLVASYIAKSGTITRESETTFSFMGTCKAAVGSDLIYDFSGYIKSDAYKLVK